MLRRRPPVLAWAFALLACQPASSTPDASSDGAVHTGVEFPSVDPEARDAADRAALIDTLADGESAVVLVLVDDGSPTNAIAAGGTSVRARVADLFAPEDVLLIARHLPVLAVRVRSAATLAALEGTAGVLRVEPERILSATSPSLDLIGQPAALARGADGRGLAVAVLDTGVDFTHADLGGCSAAGDGCPVVFAQDFAAEDGTRDDAHRHGTNVAAIVRSVAPSTSILALDVFTGTGASSVHITAALDWVIANRDTYHIVAANMSLGYGAFTAPCPSEVLSTVMQRVRDAGIIPVIASGNDGFTNAIASPGCAPAAVSVGAVDSSNVVAPFSNSASFVTLLSPGVSVAGGGVTMSGTSQATPHVAGALAALRTAYPSDSASDAIARLVGNGVATTDARNGRVTPRLSIDAATAGGASAPPPDLSAPTGTLTLSGAYTRTAAVTYTLAATDPSGVTRMCLSAATTCTTFVAFAATGTFTLPSGDGLKTLRAWLRDGAGNTTATPLSATITLDARAPTTGAITATAGIERVTLSVGASTDVGSGIVGYRTVYSTGTSAPANCGAGTALSDSTSTTIVHEGATNGTTYRYRVCAFDRAGNVSGGATVSARPVAELDAPTGTIVLAEGAAWARATRVTASLTATDASAVTQVCLSSSATCASWVTYSPTMTATLATGSGVRTVNAWFRDTWGNTSAPASDSISLDTTLPSEVGALSVTRRDGALDLSWTAATDAGSGMSGYLVASLDGATAPTTCTGGTSVSDPRATLSSLVNGRSVAFRVCAVDIAGNVSRGVTGTSVPAPELAPPTGTLSIAADAAWTSTRSVSIALIASDASAPLAMCLSTAATCSAWTPFTETATFSLATTQGLQTVRAWLRDAYGNTTPTPVTDTISLDSTAPSNPSVTAVARSGSIELTIGNATDAGSGVASYVVISAPGTRAPASCTGATEVTASPRVASITTTVATGWRVCAVDTLGNRSTGASGVTTPLP